ncbi:hypothetical protein A7M79_00550 [Acinetobacter baumannii]|uniref:hypothetical protein n=1 Tax=Acinetobacter baumannii TaxID=470 RepID=UPI0008DCE52F|nr:hypothetical protein [Acinetobacter baumannii]OIH12014.1 hypothetical protein A7M79_00550 [Acinetobacter baumannii]
MEKLRFVDETSHLYHKLDVTQLLGKLNEEVSFDTILDKIKNEKNIDVINQLNSFRQQTFEYSDLNGLQDGYEHLISFLNSSKDNVLITTDEFIELGRIGECCFLAAKARIDSQSNSEIAK